MDQPNTHKLSTTNPFLLQLPIYLITTYTKPNTNNRILHIILVHHTCNFHHITHTNLKHPKLKTTHSYIWISFQLTLKVGDMSPNMGPSRVIPKQIPTTFKHRQSLYFITNSITLENEYTHLANIFLPLIQTPLTQHPQSNHQFPHLIRHLQLLKTHRPPQIEYTLIVFINPILA